MSRPRNLTLLRDLQVPESVLHEKVPALRSPEGYHHAPESFCPYVDDRFAEGVMVSLESMEDFEQDCVCMGLLPTRLRNAWGMTSFLADATYFPSTPPPDPSPSHRVGHYRRLQGSRENFRVHLGMQAPELVELFAPSIEIIENEMLSAIRSALEVILSEEFRLSFLEDRVEAANLSLVGLHGSVFLPGGRPPRVDAILVAHQVEFLSPSERGALPSGITYGGVMPTVLLPELRTWSELVGRSAPHGCQMVSLARSDTPSVQETALALWDPAGDGDLRSLSCALEAARRL